MDVPSRTIPAPARAAAPPQRPRGGTLFSGLLTAAFAGLFVSGLFLWLWPGAEPVILAHVIAGLAASVALVPWLWRHVPRAICHAQRPGFAAGSWALLAVWVLLLLSGVAMALPMLVWLAGPVWFPAREVTEALSLVHFWASWVAMAGLLLHLALRHWRIPARSTGAQA
ncbi:MAG: hypothetical protein H3C51_03115 [Rubellimicrobium sp.]|nr:hypothetical protein [Rubellimicrobium sp.]